MSAQYIEKNGVQYIVIKDTRWTHALPDVTPVEKPSLLTQKEWMNIKGGRRNELINVCNSFMDDAHTIRIRVIDGDPILFQVYGALWMKPTSLSDGHYPLSFAVDFHGGVPEGWRTSLDEDGHTRLEFILTVRSNLARLQVARDPLLDPVLSCPE